MMMEKNICCTNANASHGMLAIIDVTSFITLAPSLGTAQMKGSENGTNVRITLLVTVLVHDVGCVARSAE